MTEQATVTDKSHVEVSIHGVWKWGTTALFDMRVVNLDVVSYLHQTSSNALATVKKEKNYRYLLPCLECRRSFTPMVNSEDEIPVTKAIVAKQRLSLLLSNKLKQEYLEMYGFVRACMSLVIVISNTLLLRDARNKDAYI